MRYVLCKAGENRAEGDWEGSIWGKLKWGLATSCASEGKQTTGKDLNLFVLHHPVAKQNGSARHAQSLGPFVERRIYQCSAIRCNGFRGIQQGRCDPDETSTRRTGFFEVVRRFAPLLCDVGQRLCHGQVINQPRRIVVAALVEGAEVLHPSFVLGFQMAGFCREGVLRDAFLDQRVEVACEFVPVFRV